MSAPAFGEPRHETAHATRVLAPNPSPMTLDGTNTWILGAPTGVSGGGGDTGGSAGGRGRGAVVDPGPDDAGHLAAVAEAARARGLDVAVVLITHHHLDHTEGAARFAEMVGAPIRSVEAGTLAAGDVVELDGLHVEVIGTPGHTSDSVSLLLPEDDSLLTGDTVLGRGTTVVAWPDGCLGDYLDSLATLRRVVDERAVRTLLPAHGDRIDDPVAVLDAYVGHRRERLDQVRACLAGAPGGDIDELVEHVVREVYAAVPQDVWPAARLSVRAQVEYLRESGA